MLVVSSFKANAKTAVLLAIMCVREVFRLAKSLATWGLAI